jgi:hypothetical protein
MARQRRKVEPTRISVYDLIEVLFAHRQTLPDNVLRSLQSIYRRAVAARSNNEPDETWWLELTNFGEQDTDSCEDGYWTGPPEARPDYYDEPPF